MPDPPSNCHLELVSPKRLPPGHAPTREFSRRLNRAIATHDTEAFARELRDLPAGLEGGWWVEEIAHQIIASQPGRSAMDRVRQSLLDAFLQSPLAREVGSNLVCLAVQDNAHSLIPTLIQAGYTTIPEGTGVFYYELLRQLEAGRWPHPELYYPDLLQTEPAMKDYANALFPSLRPARKDMPAALNIAHMEKTRAMGVGKEFPSILTHAFCKLGEAPETLERLAKDEGCMNAIGQMLAWDWLVSAQVKNVGGDATPTLCALLDQAQSVWEQTVMIKETPGAPALSQKQRF